ncbi:MULTISPECIES: FAD-dependent oxidoreductase [unclassified Chelatococcus]|uniref:FAD-dependent oxidoreductase n=1 Tax=unclassified Chelatococcus TaxID=2638111 RepID=UPI001BD017C0|nr:MULTISPECIES: FAD-dependent oxidoreductase [unclassified Chelatococcus]MBS7700330.1 FAD-dependent oxidoreductase [Chelatococcus sp. YT9]MBX3556126.1 FAD-dependent oxidoreductase [Chelatococcus sp.]
MAGYPTLFSEIRIGTLTVPNRFCFAATSSELADLDGYATEAMAEYYAVRAHGGCGLLVVEATYVEMEGRRLPHNAMMHHDRFIPGMARVASAIRQAGGKSALQLNHGGREAITAVSGSVPLGPSPIPSPFTGGGQATAPRELTIHEIKRIVQRFAEAAKRAQIAGFDSVEVHGAHGYLISQFLSPGANRRQDEYGRDQRGRARIACEIIEAIKKSCGRDYPVILRINSADHHQDATELKDAVVTASCAREAGVDALSISAGIHASRPYRIIPGMMIGTGWNREAVAEIRKSVDIPVMATGRITTPGLAEQILQSGQADMVCLSRALIADPELPNKSLERRESEIVPCIACNECVSSIYRHEGVSCTVNPLVTKELSLAPMLTATPPSRNVAVIGAGAAGLSAAITAARRGHRVTLFDQASAIGGQLDLAHRPPQREPIRELLEYYRREVQRLGIALRLGASPTREEVLDVEPDVLIVSIGARSRMPDIPGIHLPHVRTGWKILAGEQHAAGACAVLGGGLVGVETADYLAHLGHKVVLIARSRILTKAVHVDAVHYNDTLLAQNVEVIENCRVDEIGPEWVRVSPAGRLTRTISGIGTVVICTGYQDRMAETQEWEGIAPKTYFVGDVKGAAKFFDAIREGTMAALEIG